MRFVISGLKRFELTESENQLVSAVEQNLDQNMRLDETLETILELIYMRKTRFIRNSVFSILNQKPKQPLFLQPGKIALSRGTA